MILDNSKGKNKLIPQTWKERFCFLASQRFLEEGLIVFKFYLPVRETRKAGSWTVECWLFPIAPFVMFYHIYRNMFRKIWQLLLTLLYKMEKEENKNCPCREKPYPGMSIEVSNLNPPICAKCGKVIDMEPYKEKK